jgi:hypothetical protein
MYVAEADVKVTISPAPPQKPVNLKAIISKADDPFSTVCTRALHNYCS